MRHLAVTLFCDAASASAAASAVAVCRRRRRQQHHRNLSVVVAIIRCERQPENRRINVKQKKMFCIFPVLFLCAYAPKNVNNG